jgi:hypothetical protein
VGARQVYETVVDADCPQQEEFEIVRCVGHQHIGARCITLFNAETNEKICQSCPVYGKKEGARALRRQRAPQLSACMGMGDVRRGAGCFWHGSAAYLRLKVHPRACWDARGCMVQPRCITTRPCYGQGWLPAYVSCADLTAPAC